MFRNWYIQLKTIKKKQPYFGTCTVHLWYIKYIFNFSVHVMFFFGISKKVQTILACLRRSYLLLIVQQIYRLKPKLISCTILKLAILLIPFLNRGIYIKLRMSYPQKKLSKASDLENEVWGMMSHFGSKYIVKTWYIWWIQTYIRFHFAY